METSRLLLFTTLWTAIWAAPLPKLSRRVELVAGLIPFVALGLRVFEVLTAVALARLGAATRIGEHQTQCIVPLFAMHASSGRSANSSIPRRT
jgi:hypothetical protein